MTRFYAPIAKVDDEQRLVWGYASTEALDADGEVITLAALRDALDDYLKFPALREMHQLSAAGRIDQAAIDDRGLYVAARVVDDNAWRKVTAGVYAGFSVGGRATARAPTDRKIITGLRLTEISLVDRPSNPEAVFDCWKANGTAPSIDAAVLQKIAGMTKEERQTLIIKATLGRPSPALSRMLWGGRA